MKVSICFWSEFDFSIPWTVKNESLTEKYAHAKDVDMMHIVILCYGPAFGSSRSSRTLDFVLTMFI